ncbi:acyl-coenzyme A thioesterase 13 [Mytilus galloprovincialis]|uniref:Acyl-coenzyme A thioesterase 13 n=1 Tax=Mytilus galloprovincialis TaxID=29158 RepID=A0A8B6CUH0_MYTGA|nr:acyl-coenzyme A thioesterase 13 [Mytilus galloprovincialis]
MSGTQKGLQFIKQVVEASVKTRCFESVLNKVKVITGGNGQCVCEMIVTEDDQNRGGTLHGGMTATLVDAVSTWALLTSDKQVAGVSVDMGISYMKAAKVGEEILIDAKTLRVGNRLAFLTVDITRKADGTLLAQGKHTKFIGS